MSDKPVKRATPQTNGRNTELYSAPRGTNGFVDSLIQKQTLARVLALSITAAAIKIIAYQLIIQKVEDPHPHMIGKRGLIMYLPVSVTKITVPKGFLEPGIAYNWEVLAIEESGNQTISSGEIRTR